MNMEGPRQYETFEDLEKERDRLFALAAEARAGGDIKKADIAEQGALEMAIRINKMRARMEAQETQPIPKVEQGESKPFDQSSDLTPEQRGDLQTFRIKDIAEAMKKLKK